MLNKTAKLDLAVLSDHSSVLIDNRQEVNDSRLILPEFILVLTSF